MHSTDICGHFDSDDPTALEVAALLERAAHQNRPDLIQLIRQFNQAQKTKR